ncbi:MAG: hypothetical protein RBS23_06830 [Mariniphaga sp.]|nr:hypothetical protein [Mariniphaga sp.]MDY0143903.1 hypothetical protein [Bacteroidales bacterium]
MKKLTTVLIFMTASLMANCQNNNYYTYHDYINKAEVFYFLNNNVDSSLYYYRKAFADFKYVFAKDPLIASQIAFYNNKPYEEFLIKGFEVGLRIEHLSEIKLFNPTYNKLKVDKPLLAEYNNGRQVYLKSIDFSYRLQMSKEYIADQKDKSKSNYDKLKFDRMGKLLNLIHSNGFPGAKKIGIDDNNMFSEIGKPEFDADSVFKKYGKELRYLRLDEDILSAKFIMVILFHNICAYRELENIVDELISKGEVHPREIGFLYDNMFVTGKNANLYCKRPDPDAGAFKLNPYWNYLDIDSSEAKVDSLRKNWHIVPLSVDQAKKYYETEFGFKLTFGFWGCM